MGTAGKLFTLLVIQILTATCISGACDKARYDVCVSDVNTRTGLLSSASSILRQFAVGTLSSNTLSLYCGSWQNFTTCVANTGCTFQDIYSLTTDASARRYLVNTVNAYTAVCSTALQAHLTCFNSSAAVRSGLERCRVIFNVKLNYPYNYHYYNDGVCSHLTSILQCQYKAMRGSSCANATTVSVLAATKCYVTRDYTSYISTACEPDLNQLLNYVPPVSGCDYDSYFYCSNSASNLLSSSVESTAQLISSGVTTVAQRSAYCSAWNNLTQCTSQAGCSFTDIYSYINRPENGDVFMKIVRWWQNLCNAQTIGVENCYASNVTRAGFTRCYGARQGRQMYPFYTSTCQAVFYELQCYYRTGLAACNESVALTLSSIRLQYAAFLGCSFDLNVVTSSIEPVSGCDYDSYFYCSNSASNLLFSSVESTAQLISSGVTTVAQRSAYCSAWNNLTQCTSQAGCSFTDIYINRPENGGVFMKIVRWWQNLCNAQTIGVENCYASNVTRAGFTRCYGARQGRQMYPFYTSTCQAVFYELQCYYTTGLAACNESVALTLSSIRLQYAAFLGCSFDLNVVTSSIEPAGSCDKDSFFYCFYQYLNMFSSISTYFNNFVHGQLTSSVRSQICSSWANFVACTNATGCTLDDIRQQIQQSSYYQQIYASSYRSLQIMCETPSAADFVNCYNQSAVQVGFQRCANIASAKQQDPYYVSSFDQCGYLYGSLRCNYLAMLSVCNNQTALGILTSIVDYELLWTRPTCPLSVENVVNYMPNSTGTCDEDSFYVCVYQYASAASYYAQNNLNQLIQGQLSSSQLMSWCSGWNGFAVCANNSRCSFEHIATRIHANYQQRFNLTVSVNNLICKSTVTQGILQCINSTAAQLGIRRCGTVLTTKANYPYYISSSDCYSYMESMACNYKVFKPICSNASVVDTAKLTSTNSWWQRYSYTSGWMYCRPDEDQLLNFTSSATTCDYDSYFLCSSNFNYWSSNSQTYLSQLVSGQLPTVCRSWTNFTDCVNKSRCSFNDVYNYTYKYYSSYANQFIQSARFSSFICSQQNQDQLLGQSCLMSARVQSGISRCDSIANARQNYPYYIWSSTCQTRIYTMACYEKVIRAECNASVALDFVSFVSRAEDIRLGYNCSIDAAQVIANYSLNPVSTCDEFFYCHSRDAVLSSMYSSTFQSWTQGMLDTYTVASYCSSWNRFTACVANTSICTFGDVAKLVQYSSYVRQMNSSIRSVTYMCSHLAEYTALRRCISIGRASNCDTILYNQQQYPYSRLYTNSCSNNLDLATCIFNSLSPVCSRAESLRAALYRQLYNEFWGTSTCTIDEGQILTRIPATNTSCSMTRFLSCLGETSNLRSYFYSGYVFQSLLGGYLSSSTLTSYCIQLESLNRCVGCRAGDDNFPTTALGLDRYIYDADGYVTPRRLSGLCSVSSQEYAKYAACFASNSMYSTFYGTCQYQAAYSDACRYRTEWAKCFYDEASRACSVNAARLITDYLLNGWPQYLNYTYGCTIVPDDVYSNCNASACMSQLSIVAPQYITALQTGQLTVSQQTQLCTLTVNSTGCLANVLRPTCPTQSANYGIMKSQVSPSVCYMANTPQFATYQQCYKTSSSAQSTVSSYFTGTVSCATNKDLLASLYASMNATCGPSAATAIVSYTAHLRTIRTLTNNASDVCANALYPSTSATPQFLGPFYTAATGPNGPYTDYYFTCRVNYTRPATDDGARFDVFLTVNGQPATTFKTTTSQQLNVTFTSADLAEFYGTEVSCAVRSYWLRTPTATSQFALSISTYFIGIKYWTDVSDVFEDVSIAETTASASIYFQATVPVPCDLILELQTHKSLFVSDCSINFTAAESPLTVHTLNIRAVPTPGSNARVLTISFGNIHQKCSQSPWLKYQQSSIRVIVSDHLYSSSCASDGDPHIRTFDGRFYSVFFTGDFLLWKSSGTSLVEVHVRHQHCAIQSVSCNCAVAFREGNNILGVYACDPYRPPIAVRYLVDNIRPAKDVLISGNGLSFTITMPSGRYVTVSSSCAYCQRLSIVVYPISEDISRSTGLCGNYNGIPEDDTVPRGSSVPDTFREPVLFAKSFMLRQEESLINAHKYLPTCEPPPTAKQPRLCHCNMGSNDESSKDCKAYNLLSSLTPAVTFTTHGTDLCTVGARRKRQAVAGPETNVISPDDLPPEEPETPPDGPLHPEEDFSNNTGYSAAAARHLCEQPLVNSLIYTQCENYTAETKESIIESCTLDVQLTGDPDAVVKSILSRYQESCERGIQESDSRSLEEALALYNGTNADNDTDAVLLSPEISRILRDVRDVICPGQPECSGQGVCRNSTCACNTGYIGVDCSLREDTPPTISDLRYGTTCIVQELEICSTVSLFAREMSYTDDFTCRIVNDGSGMTYYTAYRPVSAGEVQCPLPMYPGGAGSTGARYEWNISISNNNKTFSNVVQLFVYDSKCLSCNNVTLICAQKPGTCLIDGACYAVGETSADNSCLRCDPAQSSTSWIEDAPGSCLTAVTESVSTTTKATTTTTTTTNKPKPNCMKGKNGRNKKCKKNNKKKKQNRRN